MHPPGAYNPRAPQHVEFGSVRRAPVLMRPIVGKRAIEHAAQSLAEQQAADERKRSEWQQHVWQENLAQQTSALSRGAEHAFRNQMYARQLEGELKVANARLSRAENRMARTEHELRNAPKLKANRVPVSRAVMLNGAGARDALAPPDGWDGPYRVRRPTGPVGPRELVVGLAPKNDHEHMPFRRALEAQYRRTVHASERTVAQRRLEDDMMSTTKLHYPRTETRSIN